MATSGLLYYYHTEKQFHSAIALLQRSLNWSDIFYVGIRSILFFPLSFTLDLGSPKYSFLQYCSHTKIVITFYFVSYWAVFFSTPYVPLPDPLKIVSCGFMIVCYYFISEVIQTFLFLCRI